MMRWFVGAMILTSVIFPGASSANFWMWRRPAAVSAYYYAAPISYAGVPVLAWNEPCCQPCPEPIIVRPPAAPFTGEPPRYAIPTPAPASSSDQKAPPLAAPPPSSNGPKQPSTGAHESQKVSNRFYDIYFVGPRDHKQPAGGRCDVAFWNLSGQSLAFMIAGETWTVPSGQSIRLNLPHDFAWRVQDREAELGRIPTEESGAEFVIRK